MVKRKIKKFFAQNREIMEYAFFEFDVDMLSTIYNVPVYYLAGKDDYTVCHKDAKAYYERNEAPDKAFYWLENTCHSMLVLSFLCKYREEIFN